MDIIPTNFLNSFIKSYWLWIYVSLCLRKYASMLVWHKFLNSPYYMKTTFHGTMLIFYSLDVILLDIYGWPYFHDTSSC